MQSSEADLEPDEYQDFIFAMNTYMLALDAEGISLGYTEVSNLADEVTVPIGALRGVIANMAIEVAPDYHRTASPELIATAQAGMRAMRRLGQRMGQTAYPATLPIGSGNESGAFNRRGGHYFADNEAEILAETTGAIGLETGTDTAGDAATPIPGPTTFTWLDDNDVGYASPLTYLDDNDVSYTIPAAWLDDNDVGYAL